MNARSNIVWAVVAIAFIVFLLSPIVLLVIFSFTSRTLTNFPIEGLTLHWWQEMVVKRQFWPSFANSLIVGFCVAGVSAILGTLAAMGLAAMPKRRASVIMGLLTLPIMMPPLVLGVAQFFSPNMLMPMGVMPDAWVAVLINPGAAVDTVSALITGGAEAAALPDGLPLKAWISLALWTLVPLGASIAWFKRQDLSKE